MRDGYSRTPYRNVARGCSAPCLNLGGGGDSNRTPLQKFGSSLVAWLDASDVATISAASGSVNQWNDKSGRSNHAVKVSDPTRPATGTASINGKNALYWDSTARRLQINDHASLNNANGFSVFIVAEWDTLGAYSYLMSRWPASGSNEYLIGKTNANGLRAVYTLDGTASATIGDKTTAAINTPYVMYVNNILNTSIEYGVNNTDPDYRKLIASPVFDKPSALNITIGDQSTLGAAMRGKIGEIIMINRGLTVAEKDWTLRYLGNKWGINPVLSDEYMNVGGVASQSNLLYWSTQYGAAGHTAFETALGGYFENGKLYNGGIASAAIHKSANGGAGYWWDTDTDSPGPLLTNWRDTVGPGSTGVTADIKRFKALLSVCGEQDALKIADGTITKTQFKTALTSVYNYLLTIIPGVKIFVGVIGRRDNTGSADFQSVREAQLEVISELDHVYFGFEEYDGDEDGIHYYQASYETFAGRAGRRIAAMFGKRSETGTLGPIITSASYSGSTVTAAVTQDGGASLSGSEVGQFRIEDDGAAVTINSLSISGNQITFNLASSIAPGSVVKLWSNYGRGASLTPANIVRDNNGYPLRTVYNLNVAEA